MADTHWANAVSGSFANAADWTGGDVPGIHDVAVLDAAGGPYTVASNATQSVGGLDLASNATLSITNGNFFVFGTTSNAGTILVDSPDLVAFGRAVQNAGAIQCSGGEIEFDGDVTNSSSGVITANGAPIQFDGDVFGGALQSLAGGSFTFSGGGIFGTSGAITLDAQITIEQGRLGATELGGSIVNEGRIISDQLGPRGSQTVIAIRNATLSGGGEIDLGRRGFGGIEGVPKLAATLDNVDNLIVGAGTIGGANPLSLTNEANGRIESEGPRQLVIDLGADTLSNSGYIAAFGVGGLVLRQTTVDNMSGAGRIVALQGDVHLQGATVIGGSLDSSGYPTVVVDAGYGASTLDGRATQVELSGGLVVAAGASLVLEGTLSNAGFPPNQPLQIGGPDGAGSLVIGASGATLTGSGRVVLAGMNSQITGAGGGMLTNMSNTISGDGTIGGLGLEIDNQAGGVIEGTTSQALVLDPGAGTIDNEGLIVARDGALVITGAVDNAGRLAAAGGDLTVDGPVTGSGLVVISGGTAAFVGALGERAQFLAGGGVLELFQSQSYANRVYGFAANGSTTLDLRDIGFTGSGEASFRPQPYGGILTVSDGTHTADIKLVGAFSNVTFVAASDGQGGVDIIRQAGGAASVHAFAAAAGALGAAPAGHPASGREAWTVDGRRALIAPPRASLA